MTSVNVTVLMYVLSLPDGQLVAPTPAQQHIPPPISTVRALPEGTRSHGAGPGTETPNSALGVALRLPHLAGLIFPKTSPLDLIAIVSLMADWHARCSPSRA